MTSPHIIDWENLLSLRVMQPPDEPDVVAELIGIFQEDSPRRMARARDAIARRDSKGLRLEVHSIRGSAGILGASVLYEAARAVETCAADGNLADISEPFAALSAAVEDVRSSLAAFTAGVSPHGTP